MAPVAIQPRAVNVSMPLKHLRRVLVAFRPGDPSATYARVLLQRLSGAQSTNPACKVEFNIDDDAPRGGAYIDLEFADSEQRRITTAGKTVLDIERIIEHKAAEMELRAVFKDVSVG